MAGRHTQIRSCTARHIPGRGSDIFPLRGIRNPTPQTFEVTPTLLLISHSVRSQLVNDTLSNRYGVAAAVSGGHVPRPLDRPALPDKSAHAG